MSEDTTTYLVNFIDGDKKQITVPKSWKVTFGPVVPGSRHPTLRFYESKEKQRAAFTDVKNFRDMSMDIKVVETGEAIRKLKGKKNSTSYVRLEAEDDWI